MSESSAESKLRLVVNNETPQTENGYTRIANELFEAILVYPFSKRQLSIVLAIIRKTYGYNKKEDLISSSQLASLTGLGRQHVNATLKELAELNVIARAIENKKSTVGLNKAYKTWYRVGEKTDGVPKSGTPKLVDGCAQIGHKSVPKSGTEVCPNQAIQKTVLKTKDKEEPVNAVDSALPGEKKKTNRGNKIATYIEQCVAEGRKPIPGDDPVFTYAEETKIPENLLYLCWKEFVDRYRESGKIQKSWPQTFRNCVRGNWFKLWYHSSEGVEVTSAGRQAALKHKVTV